MDPKSQVSTILDTVGEGIITIDSQGTIIMANREVENIWGYSREEITGQNLEVLIPEKYREAHKAGLKRYLETGQAVILGKLVELEGLRKSGSVFPLRMRITETEIDGEHFFTASLRDLTDLKDTVKLLHDESKLRKRNEVLLQLAQSEALEEGDLERLLIEVTEADTATLGVGRVNIWLYNEDRSKIHCIEQYETGTGLHTDGYELAASDYPTYFKALEHERIIAAHDAYSDPRTLEFTETYLKPLGITSMLDAPIRLKGRMIGLICHEHTGPARVWTYEEQNFAGSIADFVSLTFETRDRRRAEISLKESEEKYRTLIENTYDYIYEASVDGKFVYLSSKHKDILGYEPEEFIGRDIFELIHPDDRATVKEEFQKIIYNSTSGHAVYRYMHKNGEWLWFEATGKPYVTSGGKTRILIFGREITERIKAEEALRETLDQLSRKSRYEAIISAVTRSVHQSTNLENVFENAVQSIHDNIERADNVSIYLVEGEEAVLKAHRGYVDWYIKRVSRIPYPRGYSWKVIMDEMPRYCPDVDGDTVIGPAGRELGIKSYLSLPILYAGKTIGTININSFLAGAFDDEELKLLEIVGDQISVAIGNARQKGALQEAMSEVEMLKKRLKSKKVFIVQDETVEQNLGGIIGRSFHIRKAVFLAEQLAPTDTPVLITGGPGTGKHLFADTIHKNSRRAANPFLKISLTDIGENLDEVRLYGFEEKGINSSAISVSIGSFELANKGTLYIKDIERLSSRAQVTLLGILQDQAFVRPGSSRVIKVDTRVIAGTNGELESLVENGHFLEDLYNELSSSQIILPPLSDRKEDVPLLAQYFVHKHGKKTGKEFKSIYQKLIENFDSYDWSENVRKLENIIRETVNVSYN
jgi:PAS domain S-box-containing protein